MLLRRVVGGRVGKINVQNPHHFLWLPGAVGIKTFTVALSKCQAEYMALGIDT